MCTRQVQNSIEASAYQLIVDTIDRLGVADEFEITRGKITCIQTGSTFIFKGLSTTTEQSVKSLESIDICWIEEAQTITSQSLAILIPTIRKAGSQLIFSFNPTLVTDAVSKIFLGSTLPPDTLIEKVNYTDNPMCSETILQEAEFCRVNDPDAFGHIWLGEHIKSGEQQIFNSATVLNSHKLVPTYTDEPIVAGLDVARFGDDKSALCIRHGNRILSIQSWSKLDSNELARIVANEIMNNGIQRLIIDASGGYGGGVYDALTQLISSELCDITEFYGASRASNTARYGNARAETYFMAANWIKDGGVLVQNNELEEEMIIIRYKYNTRHQMMVEAKEELKKASRLGRSPDLLDAFTMTFYAEEINQDIDLQALTNGGSLW